MCYIRSFKYFIVQLFCSSYFLFTQRRVVGTSHSSSLLISLCRPLNSPCVLKTSVVTLLPPTHCTFIWTPVTFKRNGLQ
ncbi:hypothetical protein CDAR_16071 [Caerostris darwini]|uniref:Secreted protein n=1 Tax=Caerostris darwini TaxID=1538125 RepID=A0AAV4QR35_9ARAC|nr:hypothetical protein CDAR_16071 [Caerostris darwini]